MYLVLGTGRYTSLLHARVVHMHDTPIFQQQLVEDQRTIIREQICTSKNMTNAERESLLYFRQYLHRKIEKSWMHKYANLNSDHQIKHIKIMM